MAEVTNTLTGLGSLLGGEVSLTFTLLFFTAIIAAYAVFVFYFYKFLAKKNIIELNLSKYNTYEGAGVIKFFAVVFYILEFLVILPIVTIFWFAILSVLLLLLAKSLDASTVLIIAAALVASVRLTSYLSQNLSQDLAKMLPFTLLGLALTQPNFFSISILLERIETIPSLLSRIPYYILFIILLELIMRVVDFIRGIFTVKAEEETDEETKE